MAVLSTSIIPPYLFLDSLFLKGLKEKKDRSKL